MNFAELILALWDEFRPLFMVRSYQEGVRWTFGRNPKLLGPGLHFRIPIIQELEIISVVDDYLAFPVQSVITRDGELVCFDAMIGYRIDDAVKHFCEVVDFRDATQELAMAHLAQRVRDWTYEELTAEGGLKSLEKSLEGTLTTRVKGWGTRIIDVGFTNFAKVPYQFRLFGIKD